MTNKIFQLDSVFKAIDSDDEGIYIEGMASTNDQDRVGDIIPAEAWTAGGGLKNFKANPIILFNHNYGKPIGKATEIEPTSNGLRIKAYISKHAPDGVYNLIKESILGAFSVGFLIQDAEFIEETNGFKIKEAELLETSVVSIPMNQAATFSLAKSFDSESEYDEFKKTFTNREDLAGQNLAKQEVNASNIASDSLEGAPTSAQKEIKMTTETKTVDLEAIAQKAAEKATAAYAMKQAEKQAKNEKEAADLAAKEAENARVAATVEAGVQSGAEQLTADLENKMTERGADLDAIIKEFKEELKEKSDELEAMANSKRIFVDRTSNMTTKQAVEANKDQFVQASLYGTITGKGWDTDLARNVIEKAGMDYTTDTTAGDLDQEVRDIIQKEIWVQTKVASLFREIEVNGRATVFPLQSDTGYADWGINQGFVPAAHGNLENRGEAVDADVYKARSVTMLVDRMISSTYIDNDVEEKTLVNLLPMLFEGVARAHARKVESAIMYPSAYNAGAGDVVANITDIENAAAASGVVSSPLAATTGAWTANNLVAARGTMGKYGLNPEDIAYVVAMEVYYDLLQDPEFQNLNEVGAIATKLRGVVGGIFGSPVIVSEEFPAGDTVNAIGAYVINRRNYIIPRLRGINVESDYEVANQRKMIVASQSLGFTELWAGVTGHQPSVSVAYAAT
jgi:HK97 family phage prohead protease